MHDPHLNLFYTYNRDNQLIENNLTRAWIVTLRLLSSGTRNLLLGTLFTEPIRALGGQLLYFGQASFGLQNFFDIRQLDRISQRYMVTMATDREMDLEGAFETFADVEDWSGSIPDAWIYDPVQGYCFLIEAKIGANPLNTGQVIAHAVGWLGIPQDQLAAHLIPLTWYDVVRAVQALDPEGMTPVEAQLLQDFTQYLGFYGYRFFQGFDFSILQTPPAFTLITS